MMTRTWTIVRLALSLLLVPDLGGAADDTNYTGSKLLVHIPHNLASKSDAGYTHELAVTYGLSWWMSGPRSLTEYVYYLDEALCTPLGNMTEGYPISDPPREPPFIVMVNDGSCGAVTKTRNAQLLGASAVLIADNLCKCNDTSCTDVYKDSVCDSTRDRLVDDGSGQDISIPSVLIYKDLAEILKKSLRDQGQPVLLELQWNLYHTKKPYFHLWTTAHDPLIDLQSYVNLHLFATKFAGSVEFEPRFSIVNGTRFNCGSESNNTLCDHLCTSKGRYCAYGGKDSPSGHDQVVETLRRLCIWDKEKESYWDYVVYFKEHCSNLQNFNNTKCVEDALHHSRLKKTKDVESCMKDSGELDKDSTNRLLQGELDHQRRSGVQGLPTITVNRHNVGMDVGRLFEFACTSIWMSDIDKVPKLCETCASCPNKMGCLEKGKCVEFSNNQRHPNPPSGNTAPKKNHHVFAKIFWTFAMLGLIVGGWYYYNNHREQFPWNNRNRSGLLNDYMHLPGEG